MAKFGVTSALLSIVLSVFMAGLGLGSWSSGRLIRHYAPHLARHALRIYGLAEFFIGLSALVAPLELSWGRNLLGDFSLASSAAYYSISGVVIALTLIPWCACMGATIPFAMLAIRKSNPADSERSFSYLYLANVLGAFLGALGPAVLVELYGFRGALRIGAVFNFLLAAVAFGVAARTMQPDTIEPGSRDTSIKTPPREGGRILLLLFATGCTSMGAEVVWVRQFTPYVSTVVYAFALLLALYLVSTYIGSRIYRRRGQHGTGISPVMCAALGLCGVLAAMTADPQLHISRALRLIIGISPLCGMMGFVTPMLIDRWSAGDPDRAGSAYAVNVIGCIVGPLLSGFLLLPHMAERWVLIVFALPWLVFALAPSSLPRVAAQERRPSQRIVSVILVAVVFVVVFASRGFEAGFSHYEVLRDDTATVIATGKGMHRRLLVNGIGITELTPTTKMMAHLPLAFLLHSPQNALAICFGMGTSYRSLMSWNIPITAVELVPSVPKLFWYFHADAHELLNSPLSHVVINDGRAYLERSKQQYDVITIDPPPPVEAAGSSLLYSTEFYSVIRQRLRPGGILQQWLPKDDNFLQASIARSLAESFPYVRVFAPMTGAGLHFLASDTPLPRRTAEELAARMPSSAARDLTEWGPEKTAAGNFALVLGKEETIEEVLARDVQAPALTDDRPVNEFYALRRYVRPGLQRTWTWLTGTHNKSTVTQN
ncbi:MAG TPA: fused MFS/spermidine synthase [Terriglobales bacterium]|nr:fused MFS/spermidine synthase [Terriglobales bacterium]